MADSGIYRCDFPRLQPSQTFYIELVVDPVLKDRTGENIPGAAPEPCIRTLDDTEDWRLLQCEAHGVPRPTLKWKDSDNNTLPAEKPHISERGGRFYITVKVTVTKTDNYRCVATQETLSHQVVAETYVYIQGWSGWRVVEVIGLLLVGACIVGAPAWCYIRRLRQQIPAEGPTPDTPNLPANGPTNTETRNTTNGQPDADQSTPMIPMAPV
ncbi:CD166 antigen homolog [Sparus aurata]|uniref:CD166 antigen homolog n=1 Tax=Sparus aurata TaxID=8175 RepID=UPI0011C0D365|nr:CD166 antigen homolog [Sparus aurata]